MMVWIHILGIAAIIISGITYLNNWLTKYALIVWILQNTNTQPSKEEMIECKKFVIQHVLEDLRKMICVEICVIADNEFTPISLATFLVLFQILSERILAKY